MLYIIKNLLFVILILCCNTNANQSNNDSNNNKNNNNSTQQKSKKAVRILSLDGGGTRGYIQAKFLELLCNEYNIKNLSKYFDIIVGTSVGGLNTILITHGITPSKLIEFYRNITPWIFTIRSIKDIFSNNTTITSNKPNTLQKLLFMIFSNPFYKSVSESSNYGDARLRKEINDVFGDKLLNSIKTPILLTAYNDSGNSPMIFTNVKLPSIPNTFTDIKIVDAVMATMSAPIYFPKTRVSLSSQYKDQYIYIMDGGIFQNNPSLLALIAAQSIYPNAERYCILSIGTGRRIRKRSLNLDTEKLSLSKTITTQYNLYGVTLSNAMIANDIVLQNISKFSKKPIISYYRFNFTLDNKINCAMDTSTPEFFDYLDNAVKTQYELDQSKIKEFVKNMKDTNNE